MHTVRWNDDATRFQIVMVTVVRAAGTDGPDDPGEFAFEPVYTFPAGTTNAEACAAFDRWRETGDLPE